jgi:hypothetical protein
LGADLNDLTWTVSNGEVTVSAADESIVGSLDIPSMIDGFSITGIADKGFLFCFKEVSIGESVNSIGQSAIRVNLRLNSLKRSCLPG